MSKIAVLGRGTSLRRYAQFSHLFEKVYLVNPFSAEIQKLGSQHFQGKELVHVVSRGNDCRLKQDQYKLFAKTTTTANITKGIQPPKAMPGGTPTQAIGSFRYINFQPMSEAMKKRGFPLVGWNDVTLVLKNMGEITGNQHVAIIGQLEAGFSDVIAANNDRATSTTRCWPTTGLFAIELALVHDAPEEIYLFGFDCFQNGTDSYFIKRQKSHQTKDAQVVMKYYLKHLVQEFAATQFYSADDQPHIAEANWRTIPSKK